MAECVLNCPIDRCFQGPPVVCADADVIEKGQIETIGTSAAATVSMLVVAAGAADGLTQRTADAAAGVPARPDRWAPLFTVEDCTVDKLAGDDAIAAGTQLWFSEDDNCFTTDIANIDASGVCFPAAQAIELSNDVDDTVRVTFDGRLVTGVAGTG